MAEGALKENRRKATESEKSISIALIGGAFAIMVGVLWAAPGFSDKVSHLGQVIVAWAGIIGCLLLISSIVSGGLGIAYDVRPGNWNHFDLQAKLGILALIVLLAAPITVLSTLRPPAGDVPKELDRLRNELGGMKATLSTQLNTVKQTAESNVNEISSLRKEIDVLKERVDFIHQGVGKRNEQNEEKRQ